jgi:hypothetical protein
MDKDAWIGLFGLVTLLLVTAALIGNVYLLYYASFVPWTDSMWLLWKVCAAISLAGVFAGIFIVCRMITISRHRKI